MNGDLSHGLQIAVKAAAQNNKPLALLGSGSKSFYGRAQSGEPLSLLEHRGVVSYEPKELVLSARAGTPVRELHEILDAHGQMLAFEPPAFGQGATLGGVIACGLSGPARPFRGSARDFVLGMKIISGRGDIMRFGGEVMKNVAGYDIPRLMTGAMGTLGIILDVSLKVLPRPEHEISLSKSMQVGQSITSMNQFAGMPLPLSGACYADGLLHIRLSGEETAVKAAASRIGGDTNVAGADFWAALREQQLPFFTGNEPLWRLSMPSVSPNLDLPGRQIIDWGGAQRWLVSDADMHTVRQAVCKSGGHATLFRGGDRLAERFHPAAPGLAEIFRQIKQAFDPHALLNRGRMYQEF